MTAAFDFFLERAADFPVNTGPYANETQFVLVEDAVEALVIHVDDVAAVSADEWAAVVDRVSRILGCESKRQHFAVELLVAAAIRIAKEGRQR